MQPVNREQIYPTCHSICIREGVFKCKYIPPTIQFVLGKGCNKIRKNAIKSGKMLIKSAILVKFELEKWIFSLFC